MKYEIVKCDMCKKEVDEDFQIKTYQSEFFTGVYKYELDFCEECMTKILNFIGGKK